MAVSSIRLNILRAMYLFIAGGLFFTIWPEILFSSHKQADVDSVVSSLLGALGLMCLLGLRYPLKLLPILYFEFLWKVIWVLAFATPMAINSGLDTYAQETLFACILGLVLVPLAIPWSYSINAYLKPEVKSDSNSAEVGSSH